MEINVTIGKSAEKTSDNKEKVWTDLLKDSSRSELIDQIIQLSEENRDLKDDAVLTSLGFDKNEIKFIKPYTNETRKDAISILKELKNGGWKFDYVYYGHEINDIAFFRKTEDHTEFVHVYSYNEEDIDSKLGDMWGYLSVEDLTIFKKLMTFIDATC